MNGDLNRKECISSWLVPFINGKHSDGLCIFWPDLASCHAKATQELLRPENIPFVPKEANPPNVPQLWPIEDFWAPLKVKVYEGGWEANTFRQLQGEEMSSGVGLNPCSDGDVTRLDKSATCS